MVAESRRDCHNLASARRRSNRMLGQLALAWMKEAYRSNPAVLSELRNSAHSASFCATGSLIDAATVVASLNLRYRTRSIACFVAARSRDSCGAGANVPPVGWSLGKGILGPAARSLRISLGTDPSL
jgi:hypothetical protein